MLANHSQLTCVIVDPSMLESLEAKSRENISTKLTYLVWTSVEAFLAIKPTI